MLRAGDLTTVDHAKDWLGITDTNSDDTLQRLVTGTSIFIQSWLNRRIALQSYSEVRNGSGVGRGRNVLTFRNSPVQSVQLVKVDGIVVSASPDGGIFQPGYGFDNRSVWIAQVNTAIALRANAGAGFTKGISNILLTYTAGYSESNEQHYVPAAPDYIVTTNQMWVADLGVKYATTGTALVNVPSGPTVGQYSVDRDGVYTFAAADANASVLVSYGNIPADIEQACIQLMAARTEERKRIGVMSQSIGTESISYSQKDMPADVKTLLTQYVRVMTL